MYVKVNSKTPSSNPYPNQKPQGVERQFRVQTSSAAALVLISGINYILFDEFHQRIRSLQIKRGMEKFVHFQPFGLSPEQKLLSLKLTVIKCCKIIIFCNYLCSIYSSLYSSSSSFHQEVIICYILSTIGRIT